jgi:hypothetical protein
MNVQATRVAAAGLALSLAVAGAAQAGGRWLHVRVQEGPGGEGLKIDLPLSLVESVVPLIENEKLSGGKLRLEGELEGIDLREVLAALRETPDGQFLEVRSDDETVQVAKERGLLLVHADGEDGERVRVRVSLAAVEAMISGNDGDIDVVAGLRALDDQHDGQDLVSVEGDGDRVRVWIDAVDSGD